MEKEKIIGITAEYNPFHKGHLYQIETLRRRFPEAVIVAALSGSFLQRGVPALLDAWTRAEMAVRCGVDLVVELPPPFCCHNAGVFANASVSLLKACGACSLSFGMEDGEELLRSISYILVQEAPPFKAFLQEFLKKGFSYAQARAEACEKLLPGSKELLEKPNNTLAVAYAESALKQDADLELLPVKRIGAGYRDETTANELSSAAGIRAALSCGDRKTALSVMPEASAAVLKSQLDRGRALLVDTTLWHAARTTLLRETPASLNDYAGVSEGIEHRLLEAVFASASLDEFVARVSTKRYPRSRVRRLQIWILLNLKKEDDAEFQRRGPAYIRPLAMTPRGRELLKTVRASGVLPVVNKPAGLGNDEYARRTFQLTLRAASLRESLLPRPDWKHELAAAPFLMD